jgi:hypothetical protein
MSVGAKKGKVLAPGVVIIFVLACNILSSQPRDRPGGAVMRTPLPTLTPTLVGRGTPLPQLTQTPGADVVPVASAAVSAGNITPAGQPISLPAPIGADSQPAAGNGPDVATPGNLASPEPAPAVPAAVSGWTFTNIHARPDPYGQGMLVHGDIINNTNSTQELAKITGTFFDDGRQVVADADDMVDYWPFDIIPVGGQLPFELTLFDIHQAADFDLLVESQPSNQAPHQNFNMANIEQWCEDSVCCLAGQLENRGDYLNEYVIILAVLFNDQNQMLAFGDYLEPEPAAGLTEGPLEFEICMDVVDQHVARYELRAWGQ